MINIKNKIIVTISTCCLIAIPMVDIIRYHKERKKLEEIEEIINKCDISDELINFIHRNDFQKFMKEKKEVNDNEDESLQTQTQTV